MKYIFFDYDGTLTSHVNHNLYQKTIDSLKKCKENGNKIFLCTGRAPQFIFEKIIPEIPFNGFISCGGNYVYLNNQCIDDNSIDQELLLKTIGIMNKNDIYFSLETKDENYQTQDARNFWDEYNEKRMKEHPELDFSKFGFTEFSIVNKNDDFSNVKAGKIGFVAPDKEKFFKVMDQFKDFYINFPPHNNEKHINGELTLKSCSKAHGMQVLLNAVGGKQEDTIAFGDGGNDYPMIEFAHTSIVHENANKKLKELADDFFEDTSKDGITKSLQKLNLI